MMLSDLEEVKRLATARQRVVNDLMLVKTGTQLTIDLAGSAPEHFKALLFSAEGGSVVTPDNLLFEALVEVLILERTKRIATIDERLGELGVVVTKEDSK